MAATSVLTLKVTLKGSKPPIWRRLRIKDNHTLADLHVIIQAAMGWEDSHLHMFDIDGRLYGNPMITDDVLPESRVALKTVAKSGVSKFVYIYDFGDDWVHTIAIEKVETASAADGEPRCVTGKNACPPEDSGGIWGYMAVLEAVADPNHPEHEDSLDWLDEDFDPKAFSVDDTNARIGRYIGTGS